MGYSVAESCVNSLQNERVHAACYAARAKAKCYTFDYIASIHSLKRRHSTIICRTVRAGHACRMCARKDRASYVSSVRGPTSTCRP